MHLLVQLLTKSSLLQKSINDKLERLKQDKENIEKEIHRISPELHKVLFGYFSYLVY